jgi:hypothetical protein
MGRRGPTKLKYNIQVKAEKMNPKKGVRRNWQKDREQPGDCGIIRME